MTLRPGGILPLPTMNHKPEKKNDRKDSISGVEEEKTPCFFFFLIFHRLYPITASHAGVINSDFKCYKNKMKLGR